MSIFASGIFAVITEQQVTNVRSKWHCHLNQFSKNNQIIKSLNYSTLIENPTNKEYFNPIIQEIAIEVGIF